MLEQIHSHGGTFFGRYFTETSTLRRMIANDDGVRILSFGCSSGEELATMRAFYPNARLYGCDVDWASLAKARALVGGDAMLMDAAPGEIARYAPYDVILCNSVLLRTPTRIDGVVRGLDPALWAATLDLLDDCLRPGGFLQIVNAHIPFRMHPRAGGYAPVGSALITGPNFLDLFDGDGVHMCSGGPRRFTIGELVPWHYGEIGADRASPRDFHDILFRKHGPQAFADVADEIIPTAPPAEPVASGSASYRPTLHHKPRDRRPVTFVEVDVAWTAFSHKRIRLERTMRRIWFDGSVGLTHVAAVDLDGEEAAAFLDAMTGRRPVSIAVQNLTARQPTRQPA